MRGHSLGMLVTLHQPSRCLARERERRKGEEREKCVPFHLLPSQIQSTGSRASRNIPL